MKTTKVTILLALILLSAGASATVRTLNNNNPSPGQFATYNLAENPSVNGDTIYVSGSPTSYGNISPNKGVTIIGTGHNPNKQNPLVSTVGALTLNAGASSCRIIGLNVDLIACTVNISNVYISRNFIT